MQASCIMSKWERERGNCGKPNMLYCHLPKLEISLDAIERMGLSDKIYEPVRRLSGGQQRRVAIARTIAQSPKIILADEFLSELDEKTLEMVKSEVVDFVRKEDATELIVVEHDVSRAKSIADRMLVIDDGRVNPFISQHHGIGGPIMRD